MKIAIDFIDNKGMFHKKQAKSKKALSELIKGLKEGTEVYWHGPDHVTISQQYVKG